MAKILSFEEMDTMIEAVECKPCRWYYCDIKWDNVALRKHIPEWFLKKYIGVLWRHNLWRNSNVDWSAISEEYITVEMIKQKNRKIITSKALWSRQTEDFFKIVAKHVLDFGDKAYNRYHRGNKKNWYIGFSKGLLRRNFSNDLYDDIISFLPWQLAAKCRDAFSDTVFIDWLSNAGRDSRVLEYVPHLSREEILKLRPAQIRLLPKRILDEQLKEFIIELQLKGLL